MSVVSGLDWHDLMAVTFVPASSKIDEEVNGSSRYLAKKKGSFELQALFVA